MIQGQDPSKQIAVERSSDLSAPPRFLLWIIVGLFVLALVGGAGGLIVFRNVLRPGQQQRVVDMLPFMSAFLSRPDPNATVPTVAPPANSGIDPNSLLTMPLVDESTEEAAATLEPEATLESASVDGVVAAPTATRAPTQTATPLPTLEPTAIPTLAPTAEPVSPIVSLGGVGVARAEGVMQDNPAPLASQPQSVVSANAVPAQSRLTGFRYELQGWNNCGPANIIMALSFFSWTGTQAQAASWLKPDSEDKNVTPAEMVGYVNENTNVRAITRIGGTMELIKQLLSARFPVIVETGYAPEGNDWLGHYRTVVAYDDVQRVFYVLDSWLGAGADGAGIVVPYDEFDRDWQSFNRTLITLYSPEREGEVAAILGPLADVAQANANALEVAQAEAIANPENVYAWFNMGTALTRLGQYDRAAAAFDRATQLGLHFRMLWYQFGPFEAYFNTGRYGDVLAMVDNNLNNGGAYVEETYYWQGRVFAAQGDTEAARLSFQRALQHNSRYADAQAALDALNA